MSTYNPPQRKKGDPIRASDQAALDAEVRRLGGLRLGAGLAGRQGPGGISIAALGDCPIQKATLSGSLATGTLASPASATARLYEWTGAAWEDTTIDAKVWNSYPLSASIDAGKQVDIYFRQGAWHLLQRECP